MNNWQLSTFIVPVIALLLVIIFYRLLWKKAYNRRYFKSLFISIAVVAFMLNLAWEMLQMPLYSGMEFTTKSVVFCVLASIADVLMVLLLYYAFALLFRDVKWIKYKAAQRMVMLVLIGAAGAILAEKLHVSIGNWQYSKRMPLIPVVNVGLTPVLQFITLPAVSYYGSFYLLNKKYQKKFQLLQ